MKYIVSARKYRPMTFSSVVGQTALTTTLKNAVKSGKLAHAFLFCGPRGVGKTTCARIFAKTINCENIGPDGEACNECESCRAFNEQRSLNIFELDAASNNGVDYMKQLTDQTRVPPQVGRYKVFIIDEVHMLSQAAFNAFLKTLEEPPSYVIFILATTEKHKILPTIISRCQIYDFERMDVPHIINHLKMVAEKEGITYDEDSLNLIAEKADGGMRDALSIFDQCASFCGGNLSFDKVMSNLNVLNSDNYFQIVDESLSNNVAGVMVLLNSIINNGFDGGQLINGLASHIRNVMMAKDPATLPLLDVSDSQKEKFREQAQKCPPRFLYQALRFCNECDINYRQSSNKRLLTELTLIEIAQITQDDDSSAGRRPARLKTLFKKLLESGHKNAASQVAATVNTPTVSTTPAAPSISVQQPAATAPAVPAATQASQKSTPPPVPRIPDIHRPGGRPRLGKDSSSFSSLLKGQQPEVESEETIELPKNELSVFTEEDLVREWLSMCNRMMGPMPGLAVRMKNVTPHITNYPQIEVVVDNRQLLEQIVQVKNRIRKTMATYLHNSDIAFEIRLAKAEEIKPILSRKETFDKMRKENEAIERLRELLDLELA